MKNAETILASDPCAPSRRMLLSIAGVSAALPVMTALAGVPAIAGGVFDSPVMAAIKAHKDAFAALEEADDQRFDFEQALPYEVTRQARVQVGRYRNGEEYEPIWAYCRADIDPYVDNCAGFMSPEEMAERRAQFNAEYWADVVAMNELRQSSGLSKMEELADIAEEKESAALDDLLSAKIHSLEEFRALAGYLREFLEAKHGIEPWGLVGRCFLALAGVQSNVVPSQTGNVLETA